MATPYLRLHKPKIRQFRSPRRNTLKPVTVLHSSESVFDEIGADTGAEGVARYCVTRTTYGSYHDIVDRDSIVNLVGYGDEAYQDGTGSNKWALSISFACRTTDWRKMSDEHRRAVLLNGARAHLRQEAYRKSKGLPSVRLRLLTKAQSDRGESGFIYHGVRDPGRRTDPGIKAPNLFPVDEFFSIIRELQGGASDNTETEKGWLDDVATSKQDVRDLVIEAVTDPKTLDKIAAKVAEKTWDHSGKDPVLSAKGAPVTMEAALLGARRDTSRINARTATQSDALEALREAIARQGTGSDPAALEAEFSRLLAERLAS